METNLPTNCNQCHNACPADALKCGRGRAYFEALKNGEPIPERSPSTNPLVLALSACGRAAEHKSARMRDHDVDDAEMFRCLTQEEQAQLQAILSKLKQTWDEEHAKRHGGHGHHGH